MTSKTKTLIPIIKKYFADNPLAAARSLEGLPKEEAIKLIQDISPDVISKVFKYLQPQLAAELLLKLKPEYTEKVIASMGPSQGAAIFMSIPKGEQEAFLNHLTPEVKKEVYEHLNYPSNSVGRVMTTDYLAFSPNQTVREVIARIKIQAKKQSYVSYMYVVNEENCLVGVINTRDLILAEKESAIDSIMRKDVFTISPFEETEKAANELSKHKFFAAPVVDNEKRLLGHILADKLIKGAQEQAAKDIQTMFGVSSEEKVFSPLPVSLKSRLPWLHVNLITAFMAASVVALFEDVIAKITILAVFLPVVAGQGGNAGAQSLAIVMRGLVMREIPKTKQKELVKSEALIGIVNGLVIGLVTALIAYFWYDNPFLGLVVGLAMIVNLFIAGLAGASIPLIMKNIGLDPAQCSNIILTTVTDVIGFFAFLSFAVLFQSKLI